MKVVSKSILDEFLDGFREWRAKKAKAKVDDDPWGRPEDRSILDGNFNLFTSIAMATLNGLKCVVLAFLRPVPFIAILFMAYVFFLLSQYKDAQEIEAGAINPQIEQNFPIQSMPTEIDDINAQLDRAKAMIEEIEASGRRQDKALERIEAILKETHGVIIK